MMRCLLTEIGEQICAPIRMIVKHYCCCIQCAILRNHRRMFLSSFSAAAVPVMLPNCSTAQCVRCLPDSVEKFDFRQVNKYRNSNYQQHQTDLGKTAISVLVTVSQNASVRCNFLVFRLLTPCNAVPSQVKFVLRIKLNL